MASTRSIAAAAVGARQGCVSVASRGEDVGPDVAHEQAAAALGEQRHQVPGPAPRLLLAPEVVGELVVERGGQLRLGAHELVVDGDRVRHQAGPAARAGVQAEEPDEVGAVRVVREGDAADLVAAAGGVVAGLALIGDVAEQVALVVLRPGSTEVPPHAPVDGRGPIGTQLVDGHAPDERDAAALDEVASHLRQAGPEGGEREELGGDVEGVLGVGLGVLERRLQLGPVGVGQLPDVGVTDVVAAPGAALLEDRGRRHRAGAAVAPRSSRPGRASVGSPFR